ncbi:MAG: serine protease [Solirubrobacterales bacterium]
MNSRVSGIAALLLLAGLLAASPAAAGSRSEPRADASIIKGTSASIADYPWLAYIEHKGVDGVSVCTGTVVAPRVVLTAGHCVQNLERGGIKAAEGYMVATGMADVKEATEANVSSVTQALIFPRFDPSHMFYDAGLLILAKPTSSPALPLATSSDSALWAKGAPIEIAGWGMTSGRASRIPTVLRRAETVIQGTEYCRQRIRRFTPFYSPDSQICASSPPKFEVGSCHGDSGGPGIARRSDGLPVQVGIISLGAPGCSKRLPEVLTRVDRVAEWVGSWIAAVEFGAPPPAVKVPKVVLPRLSFGVAKLFVAFGLAEDFKGRFLRGRGADIRCGRIEKEKVKCGVSWFQGGDYFFGTTTVYYALSPEGVRWDYRYKVHRVDAGCWFHSSHRQACAVRTRTR